MEGTNIIGLTDGEGGSVSLEPGGQLEFLAHPSSISIKYVLRLADTFAMRAVASGSNPDTGTGFQPNEPGRNTMDAQGAL